MRITLLAAAIAWASLSTLAFAEADSEVQTRSVSLHYGGLDLAQPTGARAMLHRIDRAASRACGGRPDIRDIEDLDFYRACVRAATDDAVARLNAPLVTALHWSRQDRPIRVARNTR